MSVELTGPYDSPTATTLIPNPIFQDSEQLADELLFRQSMNGANYTYIKSTTDRRISYTFEDVGRGKMLEVQAFLKQFRGQFIKLKNFRNETWKVFVEADTITFTTETLSKNSGGSRQEAGTFTLTFVGTKQ